MSQKTYRIGEAAAKLKLKSYVLRFWETEFPQIAPIRTEKGQRLYREEDLALLARIRYLLHERGLTIDGARRLLREDATGRVPSTDADLLALELPKGSTEDFSDENLDSDDLDAEDIEKPGTNESAIPAQASLFHLSGDTTAHSIPKNDIHEIMAELATIRRMLGRETPGGTS